MSQRKNGVRKTNGKGHRGSSGGAGDGPDVSGFGDPLPGYFLQVDLLVRKEKATQYEAAVDAFLKGPVGVPRHFDEHGLPQPFYRLNASLITFVLALKTPKPFEYRAYPTLQPGYRKTTTDLLADGDEMLRYVHLWRVPKLTAADLVQTMQASADDSLYIAIDSCVVREKQQFVYQVQWPLVEPSGSAAFLLAEKERELGFVRSIREYASSEIGTVLFSMAALFPTMQQNLCVPIATMQTVTGTLDTIIQYWMTVGKPTRALVVLDEARAKLPPALSSVDVENGRSVTPDMEVTEAFELASYSPRPVARALSIRMNRAAEMAAAQAAAERAAQVAATAKAHAARSGAGQHKWAPRRPTWLTKA